MHSQKDLGSAGLSPTWHQLTHLRAVLHHPLPCPLSPTLGAVPALSKSLCLAGFPGLSGPRPGEWGRGAKTLLAPQLSWSTGHQATCRVQCSMKSNLCHPSSRHLACTCSLALGQGPPRGGLSGATNTCTHSTCRVSRARWGLMHLHGAVGCLEGISQASPRPSMRPGRTKPGHSGGGGGKGTGPTEQDLHS